MGATASVDSIPPEQQVLLFTRIQEEYEKRRLELGLIPNRQAEIKRLREENARLRAEIADVMYAEAEATAAVTLSVSSSGKARHAETECGTLPLLWLTKAHPLSISVHMLMQESEILFKSLDISEIDESTSASQSMQFTSTRYEYLFYRFA